ncbi:MAG TPA: UPF0149 family protein [Pseudomonas sp.]
MQEHEKPLDEAEIDELNELLFSYSEKAEQEHGKEGEEVDCIFSISELDGFLTAVLTGLNPISPSEWLPALWRGKLPKFESEAELQKLTDLLMRHMNALANSLFEDPDSFAPIFEIGEDEDDVLVDEWCYGYMRGVELRNNDWQALRDQQPELLLPFMLLSGAYSLEDGEEVSDDDIAEMSDNLPDLVFAVRDFWLAEAEKPKAPKTGRNDPCPCGSGKKFKQCCLH